MSSIVFGDIEQFRQGDNGIFATYEFPFTVLDKTPGGSNLGRIEWHVELHPATRKRRGERRRRIAALWVWASQTRDKRYAGKVFKFDTSAEALMQDSLDRNFRPWYTSFCEEHKGAVILSAYPDNNHSCLIVSPYSSISCNVRFR